MSTPIVRNWQAGTDFEMFLIDLRTKEIISAEGLIQGTKWEPYQFDPSNKYFATSLDNVLAECTIPPTNDGNKFLEYVNKSLDYVRSVLPMDVEIANIPAAVLLDKYLQSETAKTFGCEGDINVWLRAGNPKPQADNPNLRSSGMHLHTSYDEPCIETTEKLVKAYDLFHGVPSVIIEPDNERRKLYGKAGAFRIKEYGFEYRSLSGHFASSDKLIRWCFNNMKNAIDFVNAEKFDEIEAVGDQIQAAINTSDKVLAGNLIRQFEIPMP